MMNAEIYKYGSLHAAGAFLYIALVSVFMTYAPHVMGTGENTFAPIIFLTLFVTSAGVMAMLVFGRPVMWYLDGKKKEAVLLAITTILSLALMGAILFVILALTTEPSALPASLD